MNWNDVFTSDYSVFDFETSGLNEELDHIIEIGLLEVRGNSLIGPNSWVVNPNFPEPFHVTTEITMRTGITDTEITYGADPRELFPSFMRRIRWLPIWGHNILRFDTMFIDEECKRMCTIPPPKSSWFDTAAIFKAWRLSLPDQKWTREPTILQQIEEYETFDDYGRMILNKPIKGLYYNLPYCCETLGIDTSDIKLHRAGGDVTATHRVREALKSLILG
jgi:DNA polymerase III epsilon subunit-like protein